MGFQTWQERDSFQEMYGDFFAGLLEEVLSLIESLVSRSLIESEAKIRVKSRFADLMEKHVPSCHAPVAAYRTRTAEAEALQNRLSAENEERRIQRRKDEEEARERDAAERMDARIKTSRAAEVALKAELIKIRAEEQRQLQERM
jgi:hypothetical protein